ncbi:MAG: DUF192 domain-containing protein [Clostridiales bacterium]|nr:DUF192 domain-containing protein [Clostridiales bacterium]
MSPRQLKIEIADTPSSREQGLMFRNHLEDNSGMMFKFTKPENLKFWGMNTFIPLSIAFISPDNKITNIEQISPFSLKCVESNVNCSIAIEANHDFFDKNDIGIGSSIDIIKDGIQNYIIFK